MTNPENNVITYSYDSNNRRTQIKRNGGLVTGFECNLAGKRTKKTLGNGCYTTYACDDAGRLLSLHNLRSNGDVLSNFNYTLDAVGNAERWARARRTRLVKSASLVHFR